MTTIVLVRHGESEANRAGLLEGYADAPLTDLGREQAIATAAGLKDMAKPFDVVIASPLRRARDTAAPIAAALGLPFRTDPRLRAGEGRVGQPESEAADEMTALFEELKAEGAEWVIAVSHRLPIRAFLSRTGSQEAAQSVVNRLRNGGIVMTEI